MAASSRKSTFVKLTPRKFIPNSEIQVEAGFFNYSTLFIKAEPVAMYQYLSGSLSSLSFTYDPLTGKTDFIAFSAVNDDIYADYSLYFTNNIVVEAYDNPVAETGGIKEWLPRLSSHPSFSQGAKDQLSGIISVSSSSVSLVNEDFYFNQFLTRYDNYKNKEFVAYVKIGEDFRRLASGYIASFRAGKQVSFSVKSLNRIFEKSATFGNAKRYIQANQSDWPNIDAQFEGTVIPHCAGHSQIIPGRTGTGLGDLDFDQLHDAIFVGTDGSPQWILGTVPNPFSLSGNSYGVSEFSRFSYAGIPSTSINVPSSIMKYFALSMLVDGTHASGTYALRINDMDFVNNRITLSGQPVGAINGIIIRPAIVFINGTPILPSSPFSTRTFSSEGTTNGDTLLKLDYNASLGAADQAEVKFYLRNNDGLDQTEMAQKLIESAGFSVNGTQFTEAQSQSDKRVVQNIGDDGQIKSIGFYLEQIAYANNGLITFNDQDDIAGYKVINGNLSGNDWTVTSTEILEPELFPTVEYQDTISDITAFNPNYLTKIYLTNSRSEITSDLSRALNSDDKIFDFEHYMEDSGVIAQAKLDLLAAPKYFYTFTLKSDDYYLMQVGEIVTIDDVDNKLLSADSSVSVIIVSIRKSALNVEVLGYVYQEIS